MRCNQCGLPLSPQHTSCRRCGAPVNPSHQARTEGSPLPMSPLAPQTPFSAPQPPQARFEDRQAPPPEPAPQGNMQANFPRPSSPPVFYPTNNLPNRSGGPLADRSSAQSSTKITRIGLTSAGLCIIAGSLLLIFVYLLGQGFIPIGGTSSISEAQLTSTARANQTATAIQLSTPTPLPTTPTPTLPGQSLLSTAVLSDDFNVIQPLTDFKVNEKIYVVLSLNAGGNSRAVCLNWYLNDQSVNKFAFEIDPTGSYNYYSYTIMTITGRGRVDISLASTTACTDAIMAKKLNFTVSS
jgi:hypothetical protein